MQFLSQCLILFQYVEQPLAIFLQPQILSVHNESLSPLAEFPCTIITEFKVLSSTLWSCLPWIKFMWARVSVFPHKESHALVSGCKGGIQLRLFEATSIWVVGMQEFPRVDMNQSDLLKCDFKKIWSPVFKVTMWSFLTLVHTWKVWL